MNSAFLAGIALVLMGATDPSNADPYGTDGQFPPSIESRQRYDCGSIRAELKYDQERRMAVEPSELRDAIRVTFRSLSINGSMLSNDERSRLRELFGSYAWIERVDAMCYAETLTIDVLGMPLEPFIARAHTSEADLPTARIRSIRVGPSGLEYVSERSW